MDENSASNTHSNGGGEPLDVSEARYAFETLLKCRDLELNLHVQRSNLCLVIEGGLLAFAAPALLNSNATTSFGGLAITLIIASFGLILSAVAVAVVRGADFWIDYWEYRLAETEARVLPTIAIFRDHPSQGNVALRERLPTNLKYASSRPAIRRLFWFLTVVWGALFLLVVWQMTSGQYRA